MKRNFSISNIIFSCFFLFFAFLANSQTIRYIKPTGTGTGTGKSWENASGDLQAMLDASASGDAVWVAAGTYKPSKDPFGYTTPQNLRDKTFYVKPGVKIYGGFSLTNPETALGERNIATNVTILSGDIDGDDVIGANGVIVSGNTNNAYHVVLASTKGAETGITVDGFSITGGYADNSSEIKVNGNGMSRNIGGGILSNVRICDNIDTK